MAKSFFSLTIVVAIAGVALSVIFQPSGSAALFSNKAPTTTSSIFR